MKYYSVTCRQMQNVKYKSCLYTLNLKLWKVTLKVMVKHSTNISNTNYHSSSLLIEQTNKNSPPMTLNMWPWLGTGTHCGCVKLSKRIPTFPSWQTQFVHSIESCLPVRDFSFFGHNVNINHPYKCTLNKNNWIHGNTSLSFRLTDMLFKRKHMYSIMWMNL